jgi:catecholate siderophore receptor
MPSHLDGLRIFKATTPLIMQSGIALGVAAALCVPLTAQAADANADGSEGKVTTMGVIKVEDTPIDPNPNAEPGVPYKAKYSGDERHTRALAETPQNIAVLTKAAIDDSGYTDLRDILDAQPGITLGTGENGNAFGDRYIIRGQEARSDVFVDGLRDPGMTIRESFATEQIEISKGPNSSFAGRGTAGGGVNSITKQADTDRSFAKLSSGFGTDEHLRLTADLNHAFGEQFAVRANALYGYEKVPDREPADRERRGGAVSGRYVPTEALEIVLDYYGLRAEDNSDLGSYLVGTVPNRRPAKNVPVYAQDQDFTESDVDTVTARVKYRFSPALRLTNITRKGLADNGYVVTGARATATGANSPGGVYNATTLSTHQGWQEVDYLANQTNLFFDTSIAGFKNELIFSAEYTDHSVRNGIYAVTNSGQNCITGTGTALNAWCATDASGRAVAGLSRLMNRQISKGAWDIDWQVKTTSFAVMDTVDLNDQWTVFAGLRTDRFDFDLGTQNTTTLARANYDYSDDLLNGHLGVTYKITPRAMVYLSYATASDINGGESDVGTSSGYGGTVIYNGQVAGADPESSQTIELGTKWNVFDEKLLITGAAFQIVKSDVMEGANYDSVGTFNTGESRVRGVEIGLSGMLTDRLTVQAGATFMDAEIRESADPLNIGKTLSNFADQTASLQVKYQVAGGLAIGAAAKYESEKYAGQPDTAAVFANGYYSQPVPSYTVLDVFADYRFSAKFDVRLNVGNVTDKEYYLAAYRSGSFLYLGDARTVRLTVNYDF